MRILTVKYRTYTDKIVALSIFVLSYLLPYSIKEALASSNFIYYLGL